MGSVIQIERLLSRIQALAGFSDPQRPFTRRSFSIEYRKSRTWLQEQFQEAGLVTVIDAGGNLIGRLEGRNPKLHPLMTGSHSDTVVDGGRFDGVAGVIAGLEVAQALVENHERLHHPLEVIDFLGEEPGEYGISCIGSQALAGNITPELLEKIAPDGTTLAQGIDSLGGDSSRLSQPLRLENSVIGFFELHIEQGPVLESAGLPIGIVTDIVGITRVVITIKGQADHAGTTPMEARRDALLGAAEMILYTYQLACAKLSAPDYLVATIGKISVEPNNANVVPGKVELILEVRSNSERATNTFVETIQRYGRQTAGSQKLEITTQQLSNSHPTPCSRMIQSAIQQACENNKLPYMFLSSGAGHDTRYMTRLCPAGMIFIPSRDGRSHCPEEWVDREQLARGVVTLLDAIKLFDTINL